jgi:hypothetical protein
MLFHPGPTNTGELTENATLQAVNGITIESGIAGGEAIAEWQQVGCSLCVLAQRGMIH